MKKEKEKMVNHNNFLNSITNSNSTGKGYWTFHEQEKFIEAIFLFGKDWKKVCEYIKTRTPEQSRSHSQKYFNNLKKKFLDRNFSQENIQNLKKWIKNFVKENLIPIIIKFFHYVENYYEKLEKFCILIMRSIKKTKDKKKKGLIKCCCSSKNFCDCGDQCCKISTTEEEEKEIFFDWENSEESLIEENTLTNLKVEKEKISLLHFSHKMQSELDYSNVKSESNYLITHNKSRLQSRSNMFEDQSIPNEMGIGENLNIFNKHKSEQQDIDFGLSPPQDNDGYINKNFEGIFGFENDDCFFINDSKYII